MDCPTHPRERDFRPPNGIVYLVGAGPGDPELLTLKAYRLLTSADVVVYDRLVGAAILDLIPAGVTRISVGKAADRHTLPQEQINRMLVDLASRARRVVRLKGGDPFIFGRGSEEALYLRRHDVAFEIVPGITAATACSAYAGVPLTHRGASRGVQIVTGHLRDNEALDLDWRALANPESTLVVYMGLANCAQISRELVAAGLAASTPAMAVQDGTTARQKRVVTTLGQLPEAVRAAALEAPVLLVIGRSVALAGQLDWFEGAEQRSTDETLDRVAHA